MFRGSQRPRLLALGSCNLGASLSHGFPVSSSASRTALGDVAGARYSARPRSQVVAGDLLRTRHVCRRARGVTHLGVDPCASRESRALKPERLRRLNTDDTPLAFARDNSGIRQMSEVATWHLVACRVAVHLLPRCTGHADRGPARFAATSLTTNRHAGLEEPSWACFASRHASSPDRPILHSASTCFATLGVAHRSLPTPWPPSAGWCRCRPTTLSSSARTGPCRPARGAARCRCPASALRPCARRIAGADHARRPRLLDVRGPGTPEAAADPVRQERRDACRAALRSRRRRPGTRNVLTAARPLRSAVGLQALGRHRSWRAGAAHLRKRQQPLALGCIQVWLGGHRRVDLCRHVDDHRIRRPQPASRTATAQVVSPSGV